MNDCTPITISHDKQSSQCVQSEQQKNVKRKSKDARKERENHTILKI